jgi:hypothetical protein
MFNEPTPNHSFQYQFLFGLFLSFKVGLSFRSRSIDFHSPRVPPPQSSQILSDVPSDLYLINVSESLLAKNTPSSALIILELNAVKETLAREQAYVDLATHLVRGVVVCVESMGNEGQGKRQCNTC